ncbi:hypothetical protein ACFWWN_31375, partial [Streptomyces sp. NPDC059082]
LGTPPAPPRASRWPPTHPGGLCHPPAPAAGPSDARVRVGGGWGVFSQLVGAGDLDDDGRPDLIAYGAGGTSVYRSTGSVTAPFVRRTTSLYAGEGAKFTSVL